MSRPRSTVAPSLRVLVVDDEKNIRVTLSMYLESFGCKVEMATDPAAALDLAVRSPYDLAFVDLRLECADGLDLLGQLLALRPALEVIIMTAYATFDTAVQAIKRGAVDYLPKPFSPDQIQHRVEQAAHRRSIASRVTALEGLLAAEVPEALLDTTSPALREVLDVLARAAPSDAPVLLRGPSGTGKSVLARALHIQSRRAQRPFVTVNCPTLSEDLLASELFGHVRGAFTGAVRDQPGRVEAAEGGTLFLDEIGEISPNLQAKLLRFVQEKQFEPVGDSRTRRADVRVVAATNRALEEDVATGRFREDLLFRLNVIEVRVPALRERSEDILPLTRRFLEFFARAAARPAPELNEAAERALQEYGWPGNVRELRNVVERAVILCPSQVLGLEAFPVAIAAHAGGRPQVGERCTLEALEREHILRVLQLAGSQEEAAEILGIDASTLWRKRKKYAEADAERR
jgi:NtrC-family two-component system response regulator AlgB